MRWPESVPVLTAADIHRGSYDGPCGNHCLLGHARKLGVWAPGRNGGDFIAAIMEQVGGLGIGQFNDDLTNSKTAIANVWNKAMRSLGYTEIHEVDA